MWTRKELKDKAKISFRANYWKAVFVALIIVAISVWAAGPSAFSSPAASTTLSSPETYAPDDVNINVDNGKVTVDVDGEDGGSVHINMDGQDAEEFAEVLEEVEGEISSHNMDGYFWPGMVLAGLSVGLVLLAAPMVAGALVYASLVVRKVRALQAQRERELAIIEQQRSQFITDIAHDLRSPIMAISGMSHALADGLVRDEAQRDEYLRSICDKADKMGSLVNAVFDYTKLGSASFELKREKLDLSQLMLREAATAYADAEEAGMLLTTCVPEERIPVFADPVQLSRVIANLIANAIKHNPPGTEVAVLLVRQAGAVFALVADTGEPIMTNPDDLFQPFAQGDASRSASREGSGLGLSICKRIADMHGFSFSVAQPYGRFTKAFVLQCPLCE